MTEDYCSFKTSILLKEMGFDEYCKAHYDNFMSLHECCCKNSNLGPNIEVSAPTLQMAIKWLRLKHNIHIAINLFYSDDPELYVPLYYVCISSTVSSETLIKEECSLVRDKSLRPKEFTVPEEACEEAIKYCLERLI